MTKPLKNKKKIQKNQKIFQKGVDFANYILYSISNLRNGNGLAATDPKPQNKILYIKGDKVMTVYERVKNTLSNNIDMDKDTIDKLIFCAYYFGREEAARQVSDQYSKHIEEQHARANAVRYHKMANDIVGPEQYIYTPDYSGDMMAAFGGDETTL